MDWLEEQNLIRKLMRLYHQRGCEVPTDQVKRAANCVCKQYDCTLEEAYLWMEDNIDLLVSSEDNK